MMLRFIEILISDFIDQLFPTLCLGCNQSLEAKNALLCLPCRIHLPETGQHREPYNFGLLDKFAGKVPVKFLSSYVYFTKGGVVQKLIHSIKYKGQKEAAKELGRWYGYQLQLECKHLNGVDLIISVPLHKNRFQQRGYNQAEYFAKGLAESLNVPTANDILIRNRFEQSQTHKNRLERWENVKAVFNILSPEAIKAKNIILVDDVLTTGATIESCIVELFKAECKSVSVITIAVTGN